MVSTRQDRGNLDDYGYRLYAYGIRALRLSASYASDLRLFPRSCLVDSTGIAFIVSVLCIKAHSLNRDDDKALKEQGKAWADKHRAGCHKVIDVVYAFGCDSGNQEVILVQGQAATYSRRPSLKSLDIGQNIISRILSDPTQLVSVGLSPSVQDAALDAYCTSLPDLAPE
jgi:hypothetical protein